MLHTTYKMFLFQVRLLSTVKLDEWTISIPFLRERSLKKLRIDDSYSYYGMCM